MKKALIIFAILFAFVPRVYGGATTVPVLYFYIEKNDVEKIKVFLNDPGWGRSTVTFVDELTGGTALSFAARCGRLEAAKLLLDNGAQVNVVDKIGMTPLLWACSSGNAELVKLLISKGANIHQKNHNGATTLIMAAWGGDVDITKLLLDKGVPINAMTKEKVCALYYALKYDHPDAAKYLLSRGADFKIRTENGQTCFQMAASMGHTEIVKLLVQKGVNINEKTDYGLTALHLVCENFEKNHKEIALYLISIGANTHIRTINNGMTPLSSAIYSGLTDVARVLIVKGADLTLAFKSKKEDIFNNATMLMYAAGSPKADLELCRYLVAKGCDINHVSSSGTTSLMLAAYAKNREIVRWLLKSGADPDRGCDAYKGLTPFLASAVGGDLEIMKMVYRKGMNVDIKSKGGHTPLMFAAMKGYDEIVLWLIEKGANKEFVLDDGHTALSLAAVEGHADTVRALLGKGANPNWTNKGPGGESLLMRCVEKRHLEVVKLLIKHGANVHATEKRNKQTALYYAVKNRDRQLVKVLLDAGADPNAPSSTYNAPAPIFYAFASNRQDVLTMLVKAGANVNFRKNQDTLLNWVVQYGMFHNHVAFLVAHGAEVNVKGTSPKGYPMRQPLMWAISLACDPEMVKILVEGGADVNADLQGSKPIHLAMRSDRAILKILVEHGADVNARTDKGRTPLMESLCMEDRVQYLMDKGADLGAQDNEGNTVLIESVASFCRDKDAKYTRLADSEAEYQKAGLSRTKFLLDSGKANVNAVNKKGKSALSIATQSKNKALIDLLLKAGAVK